MSESEVELTEKEKELLGSLSPISDRKNDKKLNLTQNIKRTFKLAKKAWKLDDYKLYTDGNEFELYLKSKNARNSLTHPKNFYDIQVTGEDMHNHTVTFDWAHNEFQRLIKNHLDSIVQKLPKDIGDKLSCHLNNKQNTA